MKNNLLRSLLAMFGFFAVVAMFVLMFFYGSEGTTKGFAPLLPDGTDFKIPSIVIGTNKYLVNGSEADIGTQSKTGLNLLPFIGGLVSIVSALIVFMVAVASNKNSAGKIFCIVFFSAFVIAGAITQFYALKMLPGTMARVWAKEQSTTPTQEEINNYKNTMSNWIFNYWNQKLDIKGIMSGVCGCVGGFLFILSAAFGKKMK